MITQLPHRRRPPRKTYGMKAYGQVHTFASRDAYISWLREWIASTDGAEQERAIYALEALECDGATYVDTDAALSGPSLSGAM